MTADGATFENFTDEDIMDAVNQNAEPKEDDSDGPAGDKELLVSHEDAAAAFDLGLRYLEQHAKC